MTKEKVLAILSRESGFLSGEVISGRLGVTRAAVSAAVKQLREEGYQIASVTNRGYRLEGSPDKLTRGSLLTVLNEERMDNVIVLPVTDSTNSRLRELSYDGVPEGTVVIANEQTRGRGRSGRTFVSLKDSGIYLSYLLRPRVKPADTVNITAWTAVAVAEAVKEVCGDLPGIKWVNDLVMNGRKIAGILTEMVVESESGGLGSLIIGIGINVNQEQGDFPPEIAPIATSIRRETGQACSRALLAASVIGHLDRMYEDWPGQRDRYLALYRDADITCGRDILVSGKNGEIPARALSIGDDFSLCVQYQDGRQENLISGEVSIKGIYGR